MGVVVTTPAWHAGGPDRLRVPAKSEFCAHFPQVFPLGNVFHNTTLEEIRVTKSLQNDSWHAFMIHIYYIEMPVFRKCPDFRKFFSDVSVRKYRQKCIFRKFLILSGFFWQIWLASLHDISNFHYFLVYIFIIVVIITFCSFIFMLFSIHHLILSPLLSGQVACNKYISCSTCFTCCLLSC